MVFAVAMETSLAPPASPIEPAFPLTAPGKGKVDLGSLRVRSRRRLTPVVLPSEGPGRIPGDFRLLKLDFPKEEMGLVRKRKNRETLDFGREKTRNLQVKARDSLGSLPLGTPETKGKPEGGEGKRAPGTAQPSAGENAGPGKREGKATLRIGFPRKPHSFCGKHWARKFKVSGPLCPKVFLPGGFLKPAFPTEPSGIFRKGRPQKRFRNERSENRAQGKKDRSECTSPFHVRRPFFLRQLRVTGPRLLRARRAWGQWAFPRYPEMEGRDAFLLIELTEISFLMQAKRHLLRFVFQIGLQTRL